MERNLLIKMGKRMHYFAGNTRFHHNSPPQTGHRHHFRSSAPPQNFFLLFILMMMWWESGGGRGRRNLVVVGALDSCWDPFDATLRAQCGSGDWKQRYFFDAESMRCRLFWWDGCRSATSRNYFTDLLNCQWLCEQGDSTPSSSSSLTTLLPRRSYDTRKPEVPSTHAHRHHLPLPSGLDPAREAAEVNEDEDETYLDEVCHQPFDEHYRDECQGGDWRHHYYFDQRTGRCVQFWYDGCVAASENLFRDERTCHEVCAKPAARIAAGIYHYSSNDHRPTLPPISRINGVSDWKRKTKAKPYVPVTNKYRKTTTTTTTTTTKITTTTAAPKTVTTKVLKTTTKNPKGGDPLSVGRDFESRNSKAEELLSSGESNRKWKVSSGDGGTPTLLSSKVDGSKARLTGSKDVSDGKQGLNGPETSLPDAENERVEKEDGEEETEEEGDEEGDVVEGEGTQSGEEAMSAENAPLASATVCADAPCRNGGTCMAHVERGGAEHYECFCVKGFAGAHCELKPCDDRPCKNSGTCRTTRGQPPYFCECAPQWGGKTCIIPIPASTTDRKYGKNVQLLSSGRVEWIEEIQRQRAAATAVNESSSTDALNSTVAVPTTEAEERTNAAMTDGVPPAATASSENEAVEEFILASLDDGNVGGPPSRNGSGSGGGSGTVTAAGRIPVRIGGESPTRTLSQSGAATPTFAADGGCRWLKWCAMALLFCSSAVWIV